MSQVDKKEPPKENEKNSLGIVEGLAKPDVNKRRESFQKGGSTTEKLE